MLLRLNNSWSTVSIGKRSSTFTELNPLVLSMVTSRNTQAILSGKRKSPIINQEAETASFQRNRGKCVYGPQGKSRCRNKRKQKRNWFTICHRPQEIRKRKAKVRTRNGNKRGRDEKNVTIDFRSENVIIVREAKKKGGTIVIEWTIRNNRRCKPLREAGVVLGNRITLPIAYFS